MSKDVSESILKHTIVGLKELRKLDTTLKELSVSYDKLARSTKGVTSSTSKIKNNIAQVSAATEKAAKQAKMFGVTWQGVQRIILASLIARTIGQITRAFSESIERSKEFQIRVGEIRTIAQDNQRAFKTWSGAVRELSDEFGNPILEVAEAHYQTLSNQIAKGAEATAFAREANLLALTTTATLDQAVLALSGSLNAYGKSSAYAAEESAKLFKTVELGRLRLGEIAPNIGRVAVLAAQMGIASEEVYAALATLTIKGMRATEAISGLRVVFMKLIRPTEKMQDIIESWGVSSGEAAIEAFGFVGVLRKLAVYADDAESPVAALAEAINRIRGTTAGVGLVLGEEYEENLAKIIDSMETFEEAKKRMMEVPGWQFQKELTEIANVFTADFGPRLINMLLNVGEAMGGFANRIKDVGVATGYIIKYSIAIGAAVLVTKTLTRATATYDAVLLKTRLGIALTTQASIKLNAVWAVIAKHPALIAFAAGYAISSIVISMTKGAGKMKEISAELTKKFQWESDKRKKIIEAEAKVLANAYIKPISEQVRLLRKLRDLMEDTFNKQKELGETQLSQDKRIYERKLESIQFEKSLTKEVSLHLAEVDRLYALAEKTNLNTPKGIDLARKRLDDVLSIRSKLLGLSKKSQRARSAIALIDEGVLKLERNILTYAERSGDARDWQAKSIEAQLTSIDKMADMDKEKATRLTTIIDKQKTERDIIADQVKKYGELTEKLKINVSQIEQLYKTEAVIDGQPIKGPVERQAVIALRQELVNLSTTYDSLKEKNDILSEEALKGIVERVAVVTQEIKRLEEARAIKISEDYRVHITTLEAFVAATQRSRIELGELRAEANAVKNSFEGTQATILGLINKIEQLNKRTANSITSTTALSVQKIAALTSAAKELAFARLTEIENKARVVADQINAMETTKWSGGYISRFAGGGSVASDSIQALLSPGEFVINKNAARKFLPQLTAMNSGAARFSSGGNVTNNNVGDINVTVQGGDTSETTVRSIGAALRREIKRGTVRLN